MDCAVEDRRAGGEQGGLAAGSAGPCRAGGELGFFLVAAAAQAEVDHLHWLTGVAVAVMLFVQSAWKASTESWPWGTMISKDWPL